MLRTLSIVVQWLGPSPRAQLALERLFTQIGTLTLPLERAPEVVLVFDPEQVAPQIVDHAVARAQAQAGGFIDPLRVAVRGRHQVLKNVGFDRSNGDVIVFLDSNLLPEPPWLEGLLAALCRPEVDVAAGDTYIEPCGVCAQAFALFWRVPGAAGPVLAGNAAFRRRAFARFRFPPPARPGNPCTDLADTLAANGLTVRGQPQARAAHPPPDGLADFVRHGLCAGRDRGAGRAMHLRTHLHDGWRHFGRSLARIRERGLLTRPVAAAVACVYCILVLVGHLSSR